MAAPTDVTYLFRLSPERAAAGTVVFRHSTKVIGLIVKVSPWPRGSAHNQPEFACEVVWQNGKHETINSWSLSDFDAYFAYEGGCGFSCWRIANQSRNEEHEPR